MYVCPDVDTFVTGRQYTCARAHIYVRTGADISSPGAQIYLSPSAQS